MFSYSFSTEKEGMPYNRFYTVALFLSLSTRSWISGHIDILAQGVFVVVFVIVFFFTFAE